ncbi:MAG TPA: hypothetical protein PK431_05800 [Chitinophagales bacterium]|nr:hypothetical protein [Chitinophagales bacterium]
MNKKFWIFKAIKITLAITVFVLLFGFITMNLWNWLIPALFHGPTITLLQAFGLLILSKILFGGFRGRGGRFGAGRARWQQRMQQKFANMTPEEKEMFKSKMQGRCGNRFSGFEDATAVSQE